MEWNDGAQQLRLAGEGREPLAPLSYGPPAMNATLARHPSVSLSLFLSLSYVFSSSSSSTSDSTEASGTSTFSSPEFILLPLYERSSIDASRGNYLKEGRRHFDLAASPFYSPPAIKYSLSSSCTYSCTYAGHTLESSFSASRQIRAACTYIYTNNRLSNIV